MSASLRGKTVLITGAARGIGAETARLLRRDGAKLVLTDLDEQPLAKLAAELGSDDVLTVACDVCDLPAMQDAVAQGVARFGGIDLVLANAGIASYGSVMTVDPAVFKRVIDINVLGVFHTVRAALPSLIERRGYVLVVSSLAAFGAMPGLAAYNASKAGVEHFANALRLEVKHEGVDVGVAHMSWIDTPLVQDAKQDSTAFQKMISSLPTPLNRTTSVEVCATAFVKAMAARKRHVYVPRWVGAVAQARNLVNSPLGEREANKHTPTLLPLMDEEVRRLGRSTSARNVALEDHAVDP
jgi:NAD(P)-dependent dehydrogenase (short-subunit alcohol dehydrogenase family)